MNFLGKLFVLVIAIVGFFYVKTTFFDKEMPHVEKKLVAEEQVVVPQKTQQNKVDSKKTENKVEKKYVTVYFLGMDKNDNGIFKKVQRELPADKNKLKFALDQLIAGPTSYEKKLGVYSEIPSSVKILGVVESKNKIIIDVTGNIQNGGGADSIYSRLKQIIKTALINSPKSKPIYLYIDGKQAEVIGGEGIMITQPLSENSLDG